MTRVVAERHGSSMSERIYLQTFVRHLSKMDPRICKTSEPLWVSLGFSRPLWASLVLFWLLWASLGVSGPLWASLGLCEKFWVSLGPL